MYSFLYMGHIQQPLKLIYCPGSLQILCTLDHFVCRWRQFYFFTFNCHPSPHPIPPPQGLPRPGWFWTVWLRIILPSWFSVLGFYVVLGTERRALCMPGKRSLYWATLPAPCWNLISSCLNDLLGFPIQCWIDVPRILALILIIQEYMLSSVTMHI